MCLLVAFLYSQDLSNYKTSELTGNGIPEFLYSQDLSNYKTNDKNYNVKFGFCTLKI